MQINNNLVTKQDTILLVDNRNQKRLLRIVDNRKFKWRKTPIDLNLLLTHQYGTTFSVENGQLKVSEPLEILSEQEIEQQPKTDNRQIFTQNITAQKLQHEEIEQLKKVSADRTTLINFIAQNNDQFEKRTIYSKQKYMKRKKAKYLFTFAVYKANIENVAAYYFDQQPKTISHLRWDTLALFLHYAGIGRNMLVVQKTKGLITGALALKGAQSVTNVNQQKKHPAKMVVYQNLNIDKIVNSRVHCRHTQQIVEGNILYSHLTIAGDLQSAELIKKFTDKLETGALVTVYCTYLEPLTRAFQQMLSLQQYINIQLMDTFSRKYQVLKNRTHPMMNMNGFGGYILIGIKVQRK